MPLFIFNQLTIMDYNRLLKENDSLANTSEALKKRIGQLEVKNHHLKAEVYALNQGTIAQMSPKPTALIFANQRCL